MSSAKYITDTTLLELLASISGAGSPQLIGPSYLNIIRCFDPLGLKRYCVNLLLNSLRLSSNSDVPEFSESGERED